MADRTPARSPAPERPDDGPRHHALPDGGRVYIDRPLPFLVAHRSDDTAHSLARRVAAISPASILWPAGDGDAGVADCVRSVVARQLEDCPRLLVIGLHDLAGDDSLGEDSARLEPFRFTIGCSGDPRRWPGCASTCASPGSNAWTMPMPVPCPPGCPATTRARPG